MSVFVHSIHADFSRFRWLAACAVHSVLLLTTRSALAQSVWELTPYQVRTVVALAAGPGLNDRLQNDLERELTDRSEAVIGAAWQLTVVPASTHLRGRLLSGVQRVELDDLPDDWKELDKLFLLLVSGDRQGYQLVARELDVRTRSWGSVNTASVHALGRVSQQAFELLVRSFAPLAAVESVDAKTAALRLRAARLRPRDPTLHWSREGDIFRAVARQSNRDGTLRGIQEIPWTVLRVESNTDGFVSCEIISGLRSPLSRRRRGRVEQLALAVRPPQRPTTLLLQGRVAPKRPLAGYEVISLGRDPSRAELLGRTDYRGRIEVSPGDDPYRVLMIKSGGELLARLPMVPGLTPTLVAEVPDDSARLEVEGIVTGLQENLVDLVARREVLLARARARVEEDKLEEARKLIAELRQLRTREQFAQILRQQRPLFSTPDKAVQSKIDKLFSDTEELLARYLDPAEISQLEAEIRRASEGATGGG